MISECSCEDLINVIINNKGVLVSDKLEESESLLVRNVILNKDNCNFKISYINIGDKQIPVQKTCSCYDLSWITIPNDCFNEKFTKKIPLL